MGGGEVSIKDTLVYNVRKNCLQYSAPVIYSRYFIESGNGSSRRTNFDNGMEDICDEYGSAGNHNLLKMDVRNVSVDSRYLFQQVLHQYAIDQHGVGNQDLLDSLSGGIVDLALDLINLAQPYSVIHNRYNCRNIVFNNMREISSISDGLLLYFNDDPERLTALASAACNVRPIPRDYDEALVCNRIAPIRDILSGGVVNCAEITIAHLVGTFGYAELEPYYQTHNTFYSQEYPNNPTLPLRAGRIPVDYVEYNYEYFNSYGPIDYPSLEPYEGQNPHYPVHRLTNLTDLYAGLRYLVGTESLNMSDNDFTGGVPKGFYKVFNDMKALRSIDLSGNRMTNWQGNFHGPDNLTSLDLSNNKIREFGFDSNLYPDGVDNLINLDLRGIQLVKLVMNTTLRLWSIILETVFQGLKTYGLAEMISVMINAAFYKKGQQP